MPAQSKNLYRLFFAGMDLFALNFVHLVLLLMFQRIERGTFQYILLYLVSNMAWILAAYVNAVYSRSNYLNFDHFIKQSLKAFLMFVILIMFFIFVFHYNYSRLFVVMNFAGFGLSIIITRLLFILFNSYLKKGERFNKRVVVLGYNELSKKLVNHFTLSNLNLSMEGYFEDVKEVRELSNYPILGTRKECIAYAIENEIDEIYSTISPESNEYIYDIAQTAEKNMIRFKFVPDFHMFVNRNVHIDFVDDIAVLSLRSEPLDDITARIKKRLFDIALSSLVIILLLWWLVPIMALLIKLNSKGPVFFVQLRSGRNNKAFKCYKFRTLKVNKEANSKQVTFGDTRITKLGRFLRKSNIDELPQFMNVLLGNMSVVGPRPHMLQHTESYSIVLNDYMIRHFVKPGVTGWAQVHGLRGEIKREEQLRKRIEHDIWYLENWSLWLDVRIVFLTIYVTIKGDKNAY